MFTHHCSHKTSDLRRWIAAAAAGLALAQAPSALAWKPSTHAYLAQKALDDALDDGKVTLYYVDFATGAFQLEPGTTQVRRATFDVDPTILDALRRYPEKFIAGSLGPDAYPDILSGQERIHPPGSETGPDANAHGPGTDPWLQQLWTAAWHDGAPDKLAWTVGFLAHAAGDSYAHTFMNTFAGGIFDMGSDNFLRHITVEGYVGERTRDVHPLQPLGAAAAMDAYALVQTSGVHGIEDFIAEHSYDIPGFPGEDHRLISVPYIVGELRDAIRSQLDAYQAFDSRLADDWADASYLASPLGAAQELAWACGRSGCPDPRYSAASCPAQRYPHGIPACIALGSGGIGLWAAGWATVSAVLGTALATERATALPYVVSQRNRLDGANRALVDWVKGSHGAGTSIFFQAGGLSDTAAAVHSYDAFQTDFLPIATGLPEPVCDGIEALSQFLHLPQAAIDAIASDVRNDVLAWLFQQAFHMTVADARDRFTKPHVWLNQLLGSGHPAMTLASANALMRVAQPSPATCVDPQFPDLNVAGACDLVAATATDRSGVRYFTVDPPGVGDNPQTGAAAQRVFPAAFNTVTMIKLALMRPLEVNRLIASLAPPGALTIALGAAQGAPTAPPNAMLGFAATIDGSHQWGATRYGASRQMIAARDCHRYQQIFFDQRPDLDTALQPIPFAARPSPPSSSDWEPAAASTCASPSSLPDFLVTPSNVTIDFAAAASLAATEDATFSARSGTLEVAADHRHAIYHPSQDLAYGGSDVVTAVGGTGRAATAIVHVRSAFLGALARDRAAIDRRPIPVGDPALRASERMTLISPAGAAMTWTIVSGRGTIGDAVAIAAATAELTAHRTQLAALEARTLAPIATLRTPGCVGACAKQVAVARERAMVDQRAFAAARGPLIRGAEQRLAAAAAVYTAPATITRDEVVTVRGVASDGTTTTLSFRLAPPAPPLALTAAPRIVKAGSQVALEVAPGIAMDWALTGGSIGSIGGSIGGSIRAPASGAIRAPIGSPASPERALLEARVQKAMASLRPAAAKLAHARPLEAAASHQAVTDAILAQATSLGAAFARLQAIDGTYHAPAKVAAPTRVTLRGTARDGSGQTVDVAFLLVP